MANAGRRARVLDADDGPTDRGVDGSARRRAHVERARLRTRSAAQLVVGDAARVVSGQPVKDAGEDALVRLAADGLERQRVAARAVIAERGDRLLRPVAGCGSPPEMRPPAAAAGRSRAAQSPPGETPGTRWALAEGGEQDGDDSAVPTSRAAILSASPSVPPPASIRFALAQRPGVGTGEAIGRNVAIGPRAGAYSAKSVAKHQ